MAITCTRCEGTGFLNLCQIPDAERAAMNDLIAEVAKWIKAHTEPHDVTICDCCSDGENWYGTPGEHYNLSDRPGRDGPYEYNGGLCECH